LNMDKKRGKVAETRTGRGSNRGVSPPASRTRSKSPARVEKSGRDSAAIKKVGRKPKKPDTPSEETSSQSSTPKKELRKSKSSPVVILDDSGDNDEVADINTRATRLRSLRKRNADVNYKNTPTPGGEKRSVSRSVSSLTKEDSGDEVEIIDSNFVDIGIFQKPWFATIALIFMIVAPILLRISFKTELTLARFIGTITSCNAFCNKQAGAFFLAFISGTILVSLIPVAKIVTLPGSNVEYRFNGLLVAGSIMAFLFGLEIRGLDAFSAILNQIDRTLMLSIFLNLSIAIFHYIKARRSPPENTNPICNGKFIVDFVAGLEINPILLHKNINIKTTAYVRSAIMILVINTALLFKNISIPKTELSTGLPIGELIKETISNAIFIVKNAEYNAASLVISGLLVLYALDLLIFEHHLAVSYFINSEGCGASLLLRLASFPFLISFLPRFVLAETIQVNCWLLTVIAIVFILGLIIKRCSNCLRYHYRLNPSDPKYKGKLYLELSYGIKFFNDDFVFLQNL
jgi:hypothetical protein